MRRISRRSQYLIYGQAIRVLICLLSLCRFVIVTRSQATTGKHKHKHIRTILPTMRSNKVYEKRNGQIDKAKYVKCKRNMFYVTSISLVTFSLFLSQTA